MVTFEQFVEKNEDDLRNIYNIFKSKIETKLTFISFCKFCYENTL